MSVRHILRSIVALWGLAFLLATLSAPATAHTEHERKKPAAEQVVQPGDPVAMQGSPTAMDGHMDEMMEEKEDRS